MKLGSITPLGFDNVSEVAVSERSYTVGMYTRVEKMPWNVNQLGYVQRHQGYILTQTAIDVHVYVREIVYPYTPYLIGRR